jgi:hypothetical protein
MRDRSGPTGLGNGPPIGGLGLKLVVGRVQPWKGGVGWCFFFFAGGRGSLEVRPPEVSSRLVRRGRPGEAAAAGLVVHPTVSTRAGRARQQQVW